MRTTVREIKVLKKAGYTQQAIAKKIGCSQGTISRWSHTHPEVIDTKKFQKLQKLSDSVVKNGA